MSEREFTRDRLHGYKCGTGMSLTEPGVTEHKPSDSLSELTPAPNNTIDQKGWV